MPRGNFAATAQMGQGSTPGTSPGATQHRSGRMEKSLVLPARRIQSMFSSGQLVVAVRVVAERNAAAHGPPLHSAQQPTTKRNARTSQSMSVQTGHAHSEILSGTMHGQMHLAISSSLIVLPVFASYLACAQRRVATQTGRIISSNEARAR